MPGDHTKNTQGLRCDVATKVETSTSIYIRAANIPLMDSNY